MAISKVVFKSSSSATPVTWMDATPATATASDILSPKTAMLADGVLTTGTGSGGGGSSFSLLYSSEVSVTTSSTTSTLVTSLSTGITFDNTKVYMVSVRDKAGKRNGYFFGTDIYFLPVTETNTTIAAIMTFYVDSNGAVKWTQTAYGVFLYRYYRGNNMGKIDINSRYNSSYGTIDGTYTIKLYEVAIPNALT